MFLSNLNLNQFRNYDQQSLSLAPGLNIFCGQNGQGKTNALEAIGLLAIGKSHRTHRDRDMISWRRDSATIEGLVQALHGERRLKIELGNNGRKALVNRIQQTKMTDFVGHFQAVLFAPEDLQLVKGSPKERRRFIDIELGQTQPLYLHHLANYNRTLLQRNRLLKQGVSDEGILGTFDEQLSNYGANVVHRRFLFLEQLQPLAQDVYKRISDGQESFEFLYTSTIPNAESSLSIEGLSRSFEKSLADKRHYDMRMGYTSVGPHRDDILMFLDNQDVQSFASQGQQRTIALSLRLAEIEFIYREIGEYPVLLLDDVLSELDDMRQRNLVLSMSEKVQTIITTTSLFHLENELSSTSRLFRVDSGIISEDNV